MAGLGDIAGTFTSGFSQVTSVAQYILYGLILGLVIWFAWWITSFNVEVRILERHRGTTPIERMEKGRFKKDKNNPSTLILSLMRDKRWEMPVPTDFIQLKRASFGKIKKVVTFLEDEQARLQPIKPPTVDVAEKWKGWTPNSMEFVTRKAKEYIERFRKGDFWEKYGNMIQLGGILVMFVLILVLFRQLEKVNDGLSSVASAFSEAAKTMAAANAGGQVVPSG